MSFKAGGFQPCTSSEEGNRWHSMSSMHGEKDAEDEKLRRNRSSEKACSTKLRFPNELLFFSRYSILAFNTIENQVKPLQSCFLYSFDLQVQHTEYPKSEEEKERKRKEKKRKDPALEGSNKIYHFAKIKNSKSPEKKSPQRILYTAGEKTQNTQRLTK